MNWRWEVTDWSIPRGASLAELGMGSEWKGRGGGKGRGDQLGSGAMIKILRDSEAE